MTQNKRDYYFNPEPNEIVVIKDEKKHRYILTTKHESNQCLVINTNSDTITVYGYISEILLEFEKKITGLVFDKRIEYLKSLEIICNFNL